MTLNRTTGINTECRSAGRTKWPGHDRGYANSVSSGMRESDFAELISRKVMVGRMIVGLMILDSVNEREVNAHRIYGRETIL